jgi:hypothetical protein
MARLRPIGDLQDLPKSAYVLRPSYGTAPCEQVLADARGQSHQCAVLACDLLLPPVGFVCGLHRKRRLLTHRAVAVIGIVVLFAGAERFRAGIASAAVIHELQAEDITRFSAQGCSGRWHHLY